MKKWAVITGASSGLGREFAKLYSTRGYDIVLVARRQDRLEELAGELKCDTKIIAADLSDRESCKAIFDEVSDMNVQLLINCAGFGAVGSYEQIDLDRQIGMIDVNCTAAAILTYSFLKDFRYRDSGAILNVASAAGLMPGGPNMAMYYATKSFIVSLTNGIYEELKSAGSHVKIAALCPGPVDTEFNDVAGVKFAMKGITPQYCVKCAARGLDRGDRIIIPENAFHAANAAAKLFPEGVSMKIVGFNQKSKLGGLL
jgi:short-subunit dehydrogenase